jgi:ATP-binding cassette subfamily B multidrug efflux pump
MPAFPLRPAKAIPVTLVAQLRRQMPSFGAGLLLLGAYQYLQYWFDTRLARAINAAVAGDHDLAGEIGIALVSVAVLSLLIRVLSRVAVFNAGRTAEYELRRELLARLHQLGPSFYRRMSTGDIMSRVTNDLGQVRLLMGFAVLTAINTVFAFVSAMAVTLAISVKLTMASLATMPVLVIVMRQFGKQMFVRQKENQEALGKMSGAVQSSIAGVRVVRSFALEGRELDRFEATNRDYLGKSLGLARLRGLMFPVMQAITAFGMVVVLLYGGMLMLEGVIVAGDFLAFYRALSRLTWPLISLGFLVSLIQRGRASFARLEEIFQAEPDIKDGSRHLSPGASGRLSVRNLSFSYDATHPVLDGVSFDVPPSGSIAIVGRTGAGKSTLAVLLARLQPTPPGSVFLDGIDICDLPLSDVRSTVVYSAQTPFLFSTTVGRNIGYALPDPDSSQGMQTIRGAAEEAHILEEVEGLPDGFDTVVGERGVQLSGGQKQRTALARGLVSSPKVLVLDDPLSAVDAKTEDAILEAIDRQRSERGVVLITHRVRAAARCDRIVVLDGGRVVEEGTHDELLARDGLYAAFAEEQRIESELARLGGVDVSTESQGVLA